MVCLYLPIFASTDSEHTVHFIEKTVGPRPIAMGQAVVSMPNDAYAIYTNPAGLGKLKKRYFQAMAYSAFETQFTSVELTSRVLGGQIGIGYLQASMGDIQESKFNSFTNTYELTGNTFSYLGQGLFIAHGRKLFNLIHAGFTLKYLQESLYNFSSKGYGLDIGLLYSFDFEGTPINLGVNGQNIINPKLKWDTSSGETSVIPTTLCYGASSTFFDDMFTLSGELKRTSDTSTFHIGVEYMVNNIIPIRVGWNHDQLSVGLGLHLKKLRLDYSLTLPKSDEKDFLENISRFGVSIVY